MALNAVNTWTGLKAPSLDDFEEMAAAAFAALPEQFRALTGTVPCVVAEFPDEETLAEFGMDDDVFGIMGLFRGIGLPQGGAEPFTGQLPNQIWLYRRPILDYWAENDDDTLGEVITHVLVHEIGHHFGFSDDDMEAIEAAGDAAP
ncbi:MAG: Zn-dependent protease [Devosia sp.]|nr:Zn-dependent protease [Devosia sp.]